jgi:hypothetical protein
VDFRYADGYRVYRLNVYATGGVLLMSAMQCKLLIEYLHKIFKNYTDSEVSDRLRGYYGTVV